MSGTDKDGTRKVNDYITGEIIDIFLEMQFTIGHIRALGRLLGCASCPYRQVCHLSIAAQYYSAMAVAIQDAEFRRLRAEIEQLLDIL